MALAGIRMVARQAASIANYIWCRPRAFSLVIVAEVEN